MGFNSGFKGLIVLYQQYSRTLRSLSTYSVSTNNPKIHQPFSYLMCFKSCPCHPRRFNDSDDVEPGYKLKEWWREAAGKAECIEWPVYGLDHRGIWARFPETQDIFIPNIWVCFWRQLTLLFSGFKRFLFPEVKQPGRKRWHFVI